MKQDRRQFLGNLSALTAAGWGTLASGQRVRLRAPESGVRTVEADQALGPMTAAQRREACYTVRMEPAQAGLKTPLLSHQNNGDEALYSNRIGNYSKGLPHNALGEVESPAYNSLLTALKSGRSVDFENIQLGAPSPSLQMKLVNPQAGLAYDLEGADSHQCPLAPAPAVASAEAAGELVENYWMALCRDVPFANYATDPLTKAAAADLTQMSDFQGPKVNGQVTTSTLFRGFTPNDLVGPWVSQFLWAPVTIGAVTFNQTLKTNLPGLDYLTSYTDWLSVQNGTEPAATLQYDPTPRYVRSGRDIGQWVHVDVLYQAYFQAALILMEMGAPLNPGNPYVNSRTQTGFGTWGQPHIAAIVAEMATRALKGVWFQKWFVHRRLRPEEMGGLLHNTKTGAASYPLHSDLLTKSAAPAQVQARTGTYLLPMEFPEGCPLHPSYGAGHATVAGACVTVLKAMFDENFVLPKPVMATPDGLSLVPYTGADAGQITVGGELNKLAANVAVARNIAGVHYRTDYSESVTLGEQIAISVLNDQSGTYNENQNGLTFTKFDGTKVTI